MILLPGTISVPMKKEFNDNELKAQIISYLWDQGAWGQMYVNYSKMKNRLSKIVNNNGKNIEKKVRMLSSLQWVTVLKNGDTISLNPRYKSIFNGCDF